MSDNVVPIRAGDLTCLPPCAVMECSKCGCAEGWSWVSRDHGCSECATVDSLSMALAYAEQDNASQQRAIEALRAEVVKAEAEVARLREALERVANGGADGLSEEGCTWCLMSPEHADYSTITGQHLSGCPVDAALGPATTSVQPPEKP